MRVLLVSSAFNSMTQRFYLELADNGYEVAIEVYSGNEDRLRDSVTNFRPDLIIARFLRALFLRIFGEIKSALSFIQA
jgi:putative two-component system hydrogenase maturation factor HypX/HoxX